MREIEPLKETLARRLGAKGLRGPVTAAYVCQVVNQLSHGDFEAVRYRDHQLTLAVAHAVLAQEVQFRLPALRQALAARLPARVVNQLTFKLVIRPAGGASQPPRD